MNHQSSIVHDLHALNIRYRFQRVEAGVGLLVLQICLHRLGITGRPIMEGHTRTEIKSQCATIIGELPTLRQTGDNLAIFIIDQIFIDQHISTHVRVTHVERGKRSSFSGNRHRECFGGAGIIAAAGFCGVRIRGSTAAGSQHQAHAQSQRQSKNPFLFHG